MTNSYLILICFSFCNLAEAIVFTRDLKDIKITKPGKNKVTFECEISKPGLKIDWYHGERKIRRGEEYDIVADGTVHKLIIEKVEDSMVGEYYARYEKLETNAKLSVESKSELQSLYVNE